MVKFNKMLFPEVLMLKIALTWSLSILLYWYLKSRNNDRYILHAWLDKDYRSPGMHMPGNCTSMNMIIHIVKDADELGRVQLALVITN